MYLNKILNQCVMAMMVCTGNAFASAFLDDTALPKENDLNCAVKAVDLETRF